MTLGRLDTELVSARELYCGEGQETANHADTRAEALIALSPVLLPHVQAVMEHDQAGLDAEPPNPFAVKAVHHGLDGVLRDYLQGLL